MSNNLSYQDIVRDAASRKIVDLTKSFLDIIDELKKEDAMRVVKFLAVAEENGFYEKANTLKHFLYLLDENKKETIRKRVLDRANDLRRELES